MKERIKYWLQGGFVAFVATIAVGFSVGGWVTGGTAKQMASDQSRTDVVAALAPVCVEKAHADPLFKDQLAKLMNTNSWSRDNFVVEAGWVTSEQRGVPEACAEALVKAAAKS